MLAHVLKKYEAQKIRLILQEQVHDRTATEAQFSELKIILQEIKRNMNKDVVDPNFQGTFDELYAYVLERENNHSLDEYIAFHSDNLLRWLEEIKNYQQASPITIDAEDARKHGM